MMGKPKLTESDAQYILNSDETREYLKKKFDVKDATISKVINGKTWSHLKRIEHSYRTRDKELTREQYKAILLDKRPQVEIAKSYNKDKSTISNIRNGHNRYADLFIRLDLIDLVHPGRRRSLRKLTEAEAQYILDSDKPVKYLSEKFNVSVVTVRDIKNRKYWKHLTKTKKVEKTELTRQEKIDMIREKIRKNRESV